MSNLRVGYIGLGNMGAPMARRLVDWPGGLVVYDIRGETMAPFAEAGAAVAASVADVAAADLISVTVLDDTQVRDVVTELARHAGRGTVIAALASTSCPSSVSSIDRPSITASKASSTIAPHAPSSEVASRSTSGNRP